MSFEILDIFLRSPPFDGADGDVAASVGTFDILDIFAIWTPFITDAAPGTTPVLPGGRPIFVTWRTTTLAIPWRNRAIASIPYDEAELNE